MREELSGNSTRVKQACLQRSRLVPLQYILGSQPFGELDIVCRPGVLIPRWETEEWVCGLSERLALVEGDLSVWDLCCGTGCVGLLLQKRLGRRCALAAVDVSARALETCKLNAARNNMEPMPLLMAANVLEQGVLPTEGHVSVLTCNPPYISRKRFTADTSSSVKRYEPKLALIGDLEFYGDLVSRWIHFTDSFFYEVGDQRQIDCVVRGVREDKRLKSEWSVGFRCDASGHPRVVYGYKRGTSVAEVLSGYGELLHLARNGRIT